MSRWAQRERRELVDALEAAGPEAPTLCQGWTTRDLAAHVVVRERRADSGPGLVLPALAGLTERIRRGAAARPYPKLLTELADGPPWYSVFALPGADEAANVTEFFVHTEDVRRGRDAWEPRDLPAGLRDHLWAMLVRRGRFMFRRSPVALVVVRTDDGEHVAAADQPPLRLGDRDGDGDATVTLSGAAPELLLYAFNRTGAVQVELVGPAEAVDRVRQTSFGL